MRLLMIVTAMTRRSRRRYSLAETGLVLPVEAKHADVVALGIAEIDLAAHQVHCNRARVPYTAQAALKIAGAEQTLDRHIAQRSPVRIERARVRRVVDGEPAEHRRVACPIALDGAQHLVADDGDLVIARQLLAGDDARRNGRPVGVSREKRDDVLGYRSVGGRISHGIPGSDHDLVVAGIAGAFAIEPDGGAELDARPFAPGAE